MKITKVKHGKTINPGNLASRPGATVHNGSKNQTVSLKPAAKVNHKGLK